MNQVMESIERVLYSFRMSENVKELRDELTDNSSKVIKAIYLHLPCVKKIIEFEKTFSTSGSFK